MRVGEFLFLSKAGKDSLQVSPDLRILNSTSGSSFTAFTDDKKIIIISGHLTLLFFIHKKKKDIFAQK